MHSFKGGTTSKKLTALFSLLLISALTLSSGFYAGASELVENEDFRTGDFSGWTRDDQTECEGNWLIYSGSETPGLMIVGVFFAIGRKRAQAV